MKDTQDKLKPRGKHQIQGLLVKHSLIVESKTKTTESKAKSYGKLFSAS